MKDKGEKLDIFSSYDLNSLSNKEILDQTKLEAFADNKFQSGSKGAIFLDRVENIIGKGENDGNHDVFKNLFLWVAKSRDGVVKSISVLRF